MTRKLTLKQYQDQDSEQESLFKHNVKAKIQDKKAHLDNFKVFKTKKIQKKEAHLSTMLGQRSKTRKHT